MGRDEERVTTRAERSTRHDDSRLWLLLAHVRPDLCARTIGQSCHAEDARSCERIIVKMVEDEKQIADEETDMTRQIRRRPWAVQCALTLVAALVVTVLFGFGRPVGASSASSVALTIATYAVATATHDRTSHVVTAADVTNAAGISSVNTDSLDPLINLGDVLGYSRLVLFFEEKPFADICVDFPDTVGGAPRIISCPHEAQGFWQSQLGALNVSNVAIAAAAKRGRAVSGADVVVAAKRYQLTLLHKPTFSAGQGGKVQFTTLVEIGLNTKFMVNNCVLFPKTAYGIPVRVAC